MLDTVSGDRWELRLVQRNSFFLGFVVGGTGKLVAWDVDKLCGWHGQTCLPVDVPRSARASWCLPMPPKKQGVAKHQAPIV